MIIPFLGNRLYYEPWELRMFENIECEWPLFFCYLILDYCFQGNKDAARVYTKQLEEVMIKTEDGMKLVPELYSVASENVSAEYAEPGSQSRVALGRCPFMWAQSLYILGKLLQEVRAEENCPPMLTFTRYNCAIGCYIQGRYRIRILCS